jgi:predicted peptidase
MWRVFKLLGGAVVGLCANVTPAAGADLSHSVTGSVSDGWAALPYRLFEPAAAPAGQKLPLVLFLHGMGDRGTDNVAQTTWMSGLVHATQSGPYASYVLAPQIDTSGWFQSFSDKPTESMALTIKALKDVIKTQNVDTSRVYVTGLSMGGMGTWDILGREPNLFAAAVPMSGGGDKRTAAAIKDTPIWAFHGGADPIVSVDDTRGMIDALRAAGGSPRYTEIAGAGHEIWNDVYADASNTLYPWLFAQSRDGASPLAEAAPLESAMLAATDAVPEPGTIGVLVIAGAALLGRRARRA